MVPGDTGLSRRGLSCRIGVSLDRTRKLCRSTLPDSANTFILPARSGKLEFRVLLVCAEKDMVGEEIR